MLEECCFNPLCQGVPLFRHPTDSSRLECCLCSNPDNQAPSPSSSFPHTPSPTEPLNQQFPEGDLEVVDVSQIIGENLLRGWILLDMSCPSSSCAHNIPLMKNKEGVTQVYSNSNRRILIFIFTIVSFLLMKNFPFYSVCTLRLPIE